MKTSCFAGRERALSGRPVVGLLMALLCACGGGGGGGGGGSLSISVTPSRLEDTLVQGDSRAFVVDGNATGTVSGPVYVLIEDDKGLTDGIPVSQLSVRHYQAVVAPRTTLAPGRYEGEIKIRVCGDFSCQKLYDSATVDYDITVVPRPTLQSISPTSVTTISGAVEVLVTGTGFNEGSFGRFSGQSRPTRFISATQLGVSLSAMDTATTGSYSIDVVTQTIAGPSTSTPASFQVVNPAPTLSSTSPSRADLGGNGFQLQVDGSNFLVGSVVRWNGSDRPTQVNSSTQLVAQIPDEDLDTAGPASIAVFNPGPGGGTSAAATLTVNSPVPTLSSLTPSQFASEDTPTPQTLGLTGANFTRVSVALWNGSPRQTSYVSSTQLLMSLPASDVRDGTVAQVAVFNPTPAGGTSAAVAFSVSNPLPVLDTINATQSSAGCGDFTLSVVGDHFRPSTKVLWNGSPRATTQVSSTILQAQITQADVASAGTASITVSSPTPGGGVSAKTLSFEITSDPTPTTTAVAYQLDPSHAGYATTRCPISVPVTSEPTWTYVAGEPMSYAVIAGGRVFVTGKTTQQITALNAQTGAKLWGPINADITPGAYDNGTLFASGYNRFGNGKTYFALDPATGAVKWNIFNETTILSPHGTVALGGHVYYGNYNQIEARSQGDGGLQWSVYHPGSGGMVAADANALYATGPCTTRAFNLDGTIKWNRNTGCVGGGGAPPMVAEGLIYSLRDVPGGVIYERLDAATGVAQSQVASNVLPARSPRHEVTIYNRIFSGTEISTGATWTFNSGAPAGAQFSSPILVNDTVFILRGDGQLYVHDADSGHLLSSFKVGNADPSTISLQRQDSGLAMGDGLLIVPTDQGIVAYQLTGPTP